MKGSPFAMLRDASPASSLFIYRSVDDTKKLSYPPEIVLTVSFEVSLTQTVTKFSEVRK